MAASRLLPALALSLALVAPAAAKDVALVVVNADYRDITDFEAGQVSAPVRDALEAAGFHVKTINDATSGVMLSELRRMALDADPEATVVFYYAGYARQLEGRNFLVAKNARLDRPFDLVTQGVGVNSVLNALSNAGGRLQFVVIDGAYPAREIDDLPDMERGLAEIAAEDRAAVVLGTAPGEMLSGPVGAAELAEAFAATLADPGPEATMGEIVARFSAEAERRAGRDVYVALGGSAVALTLVAGAEEEAEAPELAAAEPAAEAAEPVQPSGFQPGPGAEEPEAEAAAEAEEPAPADPAEAEGERQRLGFVPAPQAGDPAEPAPEPEAEPEPEPATEAELAAAAERALSPQEFETQLTDEERREIQRALQDLGLYLLAIDADFGPGTRRAIRNFQRLRGFAETGVLDAAQTEVLLEFAGR